MIDWLITNLPCQSKNTGSRQIKAYHVSFPTWVCHVSFYDGLLGLYISSTYRVLQQHKWKQRKEKQSNSFLL